MNYTALFALGLTDLLPCTRAISGPLLFRCVCRHRVDFTAKPSVSDENCCVGSAVRCDNWRGQSLLLRTVRLTCSSQPMPSRNTWKPTNLSLQAGQSVHGTWGEGGTWKPCSSGNCSRLVPNWRQAGDDTSYPCLKSRCGVMVTWGLSRNQNRVLWPSQWNDHCLILFIFFCSWSGPNTSFGSMQNPSNSADVGPDKMEALFK